MDNDKILAEITKIQSMLDECDPVEEKYGILLGVLTRLVKMKAENDDACDKQNERQDKLDLEREKLAKEYELKMKEFELKYGLEEKRLKNESGEAANRRRDERRHAIWDIIKIILQTIGGLALIAITGKVEEAVLIGGHKWSIIQKFILGIKG